MDEVERRAADVLTDSARIRIQTCEATSLLIVAPRRAATMTASAAATSRTAPDCQLEAAPL
jgi:hypothetical protein